MARAFEAAFRGVARSGPGGPTGFFQSVDGAPAAGYRAVRFGGEVALGPRRDLPATVLTGRYGAAVLGPLLAEEAPEVRILEVGNEFFGGNIAVAGLLTGQDLAQALADAPVGRRYLLPDVCLSGGRFLDGRGLEDLPRPVEVVPADGASLRRALGLVPA